MNLLRAEQHRGEAQATHLPHRGGGSLKVGQGRRAAAGRRALAPAERAHGHTHTQSTDAGTPLATALAAQPRSTWSSAAVLLRSFVR